MIILFNHSFVVSDKYFFAAYNRPYGGACWKFYFTNRATNHF